MKATLDSSFSFQRLRMSIIHTEGRRVLGRLGGCPVNAVGHQLQQGTPLMHPSARLPGAEGK